MKTKYIGFGVLFVIAAALLYGSGLYTKVLRAAILTFAPTNCYTAAATSTLTYMTPGTGTSSVSCVLGPDGARSAFVTAIFNATSTNTLYEFVVEESYDGQDWFPVSLNQSASTTPAFSITQKGTLQYKFASSTIGASALAEGTNYLGVSGTDNRNHASFEVPVHLKRVRVLTYLATTTGNTADNGAVWIQIIPRQDVN